MESSVSRNRARQRQEGLYRSAGVTRRSSVCSLFSLNKIKQKNDHQRESVKSRQMDVKYIHSRSMCRRGTAPEIILYTFFFFLKGEKIMLWWKNVSVFPLVTKMCFWFSFILCWSVEANGATMSVTTFSVNTHILRRSTRMLTLNSSVELHNIE